MSAVDRTSKPETTHPETTHPRTSHPRTSHPRTSHPLLSISSLRIQYGRQVILSDLNLAYESGVVGIYGANGSGKSTLLRTITGIQEPQAGRISLAGYDLVSQPVMARRQLGYLAEQFSLYPYLSCLELYETVAALRMVPQEVDTFAEKLAMLGMEGAAHKRLSTLSAGQQRKLCLLVAVCGQPPILVLDEPTKALDAQALAFLARTIHEWSERRLVLIASHLVEILEAHCSTFTLLAKGRCIGQGALEDLRKQAGTPDAPLDQVYQALIAAEGTSAALA